MGSMVIRRVMFPCPFALSVAAPQASRSRRVALPQGPRSRRAAAAAAGAPPRGEHRRARVAHTVERPEAAAAGHPRLDAAGLAALARPGAEADEPLGEKAAVVERRGGEPAQRRDLDALRLRVLARARLAQRRVRGEHRAARREVSGEQPLGGGSDDGRGRRAAGQHVVDLDHLAERERAREEHRQGQVVTRRLDALAGQRRLRVRDRRLPAVRRVEDLLGLGQVPEPDDAAHLRAGPEGDEDLRLAAEQLRPLVLLAEPHGAIHERDVDAAVGDRFDVAPLEVEGHRPEDDVDALEQRAEPLAEVDDRLLAAAARGVPVEGELGARRGRRGRLRLDPLEPVRGERDRVVERVERTGAVVERPEGAEVLRHLAHDLGEALRLAPARPRDPEARRLDPGLRQGAGEDRVPRRGPEVPVDVVAVARVTSRDEHPVRSLAERLQDERRLDPARAHDAHREQGLGHLELGLAGAVRRLVRAPVAEERDDPGSARHASYSSPAAARGGSRGERSAEISAAIWARVK